MNGSGRTLDRVSGSTSHMPLDAILRGSMLLWDIGASIILDVGAGVFVGHDIT